MENIGVGMPFYDLGQTRTYPLFSEFHDLSSERYPLGFMGLLGVHRHALTHTPLLNAEENKRDDEEDKDGEEQQHKRFKSIKSGEKTKVKVPKVSFITKSEVLHLDDGYKWRKYGQKPVKNSPFPRNYYRCTTTWCDVKKRVERSFSDPSTVITTYEGQHTHPCPALIVPKGGSVRSNGSASRVHFGIPTTLPPLLVDYTNHQLQQQQGPSSFETEQINRQEKEFDHDDDDDQDHVVKKSRARDLLDGAGLVKDHGLLQDVVSSHIIKGEC